MDSESEPKNESIIDGHVASCSAPNGTLLNSAKKDCITISSMNGRIIEFDSFGNLTIGMRVPSSLLEARPVTSAELTTQSIAHDHRHDVVWNGVCCITLRTEAWYMNCGRRFALCNQSPLTLSTVEPPRERDTKQLRGLNKSTTIILKSPF